MFHWQPKHTTMKKMLLFLLLQAAVVYAYAQDPPYPVAPAAPQNIVAAEYFIDIDPGLGSGVPIAVTPGVNIMNSSIAINTTGLTGGVHRLAVRTRSNEGKWSIAVLKEFVVDLDPAYPAAPPIQNIIAAEYFIDTDPGAGNGTAISLTPGTDINDLLASVNISGLPAGVHKLCLRTRSADGRWSLTNIKDFTVDSDPPYPTVSAAQNIVVAEYFIDTDPGFGNGTSISITPGTDINDLITAVNTSGLSDGMHRLCIRTLGANGRWSLTSIKDFAVDSDPAYPAVPAAQNIVSAEYFVDTDPGFGNGTAISLTPGTDINNMITSVNTTGLANGIHHLYLRVLNAEGRWSLTNDKYFEVNDDPAYPPPPATPQNIVAAEYFIDTDPGFGNGTPVPLTPATDINDLPITVNTAGLSNGSHTLFIRSLSQEGKWSISSRSVFLTGELVSWTITPADGHDYGPVQVGTGAGRTFTIENTGITDITLSDITAGDPAFTPVFTAGTVIPPAGSYNFTVTFTPDAVAAYAAQLNILSSTSGINPVTMPVSGNGYSPGTPPALSYVPAAPYNGNSGVNPPAGQTGAYTYKILYQSANNLAPQQGYPKVGIDLNGDQDFTDLGEGLYTMTPESGGTDYVSGVVYTYTFTHNQNALAAGYRFFATDANGNDATGLSYISGPVVTDDQVDLRIFANNISFSNANPDPGDTFTLTATVSNSTNFPASNVPVRFYRDTIYLADGVIPYIGPRSSATISHDFTFHAEGYYPIKVWVDSSNTLGDINPLNNYAIRPVVVGAPVLPGGITATTSVSVQQCPQLQVIISGSAVYYGTDKATAVAGGTVTIITPSATLVTTTDVNGNYYYVFTGAMCGVNFEHSVTVTDYTFTSQAVNSITGLPCPPPGACSPPPSEGGIGTEYPANPCEQMVGDTLNVHITLQFRERNPLSSYSYLDYIANASASLYVNDTLHYNISGDSLIAEPGMVIKLPPVKVLMKDQEPIKVLAKLEYDYTAFNSLGNATTTHVVSYSPEKTIIPNPKLPDLTIQGFKQTGATEFTFDDANIRCVEANAHLVRIYDVLPDGTEVLLRAQTVFHMQPGEAVPITYNDVTLSPGIHKIKIVTDVDDDVDEVNEGNNTYIGTIKVPMPDLTVQNISVHPARLDAGSTTSVRATIKNSGKAIGAFKVRFAIDGFQVGDLLEVPGINEKFSITVISNEFTVPSDVNTCGGIITVYADVEDVITEQNEDNNEDTAVFAADIRPYQLPNEKGSSASNPVVVRVNTSNQFSPAIRNVGLRDAVNVTVKYTLGGVKIGAGTVDWVHPGEIYAAHGSFTHEFSAPGMYVVQVATDTANTICESDETNNQGDFYIQVVDSDPDLEVLSQYISPGSLNPAIDQNITLVGTVRNSGGKVSTPSRLRFLVDDQKIGADVAIDALQPGRDTTVAATVTYSSGLPGVKIIRLVADPDNTMAEEREDNNEATRAIIVGDAPDMARSHANAIRFDPGGFSAGDSVLISFSVTNNGTMAGTAWVKFIVLDHNNALRAIDSVQFTLAKGANAVISKKMLFAIEEGTVITQIVGSSPVEYDLQNNSDTLPFSKVAMVPRSLIINGDLDMMQGLPDELPGWIGGKLMLGDYDLTINGNILNADNEHFIVTNGIGKLTLVNNNAENIFPVGVDTSRGNFVKITNAGTPDNFSVRVASYVLRHGDSGDTVKTGNVNRTWFINEQTPGGSNATIQFLWDASHEQPSFDRQQSMAAHYTTAWQMGDPAAASVDTAGRFTKTQSGYTHFSPFTVTSINAALPLRLLSFSATEKDGNALLYWTTTDEVNTAHFIVEHSRDGRTFEAIGKVASQNSPGTHTYQHTHLQPGEGIHYYRLQMVDIDGTYTYAPVQKIVVAKSIHLNVYPNPATRNVVIAGVQAGGIVQLFTMHGKQVRHWQATGNTLDADLGGLPSGVYILRYQFKEVIQQLKVLKE